MTADVEPGFEALPSPAKVGRASHRKSLGVIGAVAVLAAGGTATYVAFASGGSGAQSPRAAVQQAVADIEHSDLLGLLQDLPPNERAVLTRAVQDNITSLKRLKVLKPTADPSAVSGVQVAAKQLTYAASTVRVNSRVELVSITGGTISLAADTASLPLTRQILGSGNAAPPEHISERVDLAGKGIRIAAEKVGDSWYASLFYTVADRAANGVVPSASDHIPAVGQSSPDAAVSDLVRALVAGDNTAAVRLISPTELPALHDYGGLAVQSAPTADRHAVTIKTLELTDTPISDGVRVGLHKLALDIGGGTVSVTLTGSCAQVTARGFRGQGFDGQGFDGQDFDKGLCAADIAKELIDEVQALTCFDSSFDGDGAYGSTLTITPEHDSDTGDDPLGDGDTFADCDASRKPATAAQLLAIGHLVSGLTKIGIDTAKENGTWFVTPVRTVADVGPTILTQLTAADLTELQTLDR